MCSLLFEGPEVSLAEVLAAREQRAKRQKGVTGVGAPIHTAICHHEYSRTCQNIR